MRKRLMALLLMLVMVFGFVVPMHAVGATYEPEIVGVTSFVEVDGFVFEITESVDEYYRTTRVFERSFVPISVDIEKAKMLLVAMGMSESMIDMIPQEDLEIIATSPFVIGTIVYVEETPSGDSRYVAAEYARSQSEYINQLRDTNFQPLSTYGEFRNAYIRVLHVVSSVSGNQRQLLHTTGAEWLSMPWFRNYGSLGVVTQHSSYLPGHSIGSTAMWHRGQITMRDFPHPPQVQSITAGSSAAAAVRFHLCNVSDGFTVTMSHRTEFSQQVLPAIVNSHATYTHRTMGVGTPSLGLSLSGVSIGIGFTWNYNHYTTVIAIRP